MKHLSAVLLVLVALGLSARVPRSHADNVGSVSGRVVNGTSDGVIEPGLNVELSGISSDGKQTEDRKTVTDASGAFSFAGLPVDSYLYHINATYLGIPYPSDDIQLTSSAPSTDVELKVYETTDSDKAIHAQMDHVILDVDGSTRQLHVVEYLALENTGTLTFTGPAGGDATTPKPTLLFPLQAGVSDIGLVDGLDQSKAVLVQGGFADTSPVIPGARSVTFSYTLPYDSTSFVLNKAIVYPTDKMSVLIPDKIKAQSDALPTSNTTSSQGQNYLTLSGSNFANGTSVQIDLEGLPMSAGGSGPGTTVIIAIGMLAVLAVASIVYLRRRAIRLSTAVAGAGPAAPHPMAGVDEKGVLLGLLAELDKEFEEGKITREDYERQRNGAKERLRALW